MNSAALSRTSSLIADRDVTYLTADFDRIAQFIRKATGIHLTDANERMVYSRLVHRVRQLRMASFAEYCTHALDPASEDEREFLISALTTNTTHFLREPYHFDFLKAEVLPRLIDRARAGDRVRIWSAACSSGEETYSIALSLLEAFPDAPEYDIKILGTDIDRSVLRLAADGSYTASALRKLPQPLLELGFDDGPCPSTWQIKPSIRSMVTYRYLNLIDSWPFRGQFDAIFCRNVAIYMEAATQEQIWWGFSRVLRPGGHLFIGHSERLSPSLSDRFSLVGKTIYQLAEAGPQQHWHDR